jgi:hypothetical protein
MLRKNLTTFSCSAAVFMLCKTFDHFPYSEIYLTTFSCSAAVFMLSSSFHALQKFDHFICSAALSMLCKCFDHLICSALLCSSQYTMLYNDLTTKMHYTIYGRDGLVLCHLKWRGHPIIF